MVGLIYEQESYAIRGAVYDVYREMGSGFLESVYQECLENELASRNIPFASQPEIQLYYKENLLSQVYIPDFICYNKIILELKVASELTNKHEAQIMHYLNATKMQLGLLINFGDYPKATIRRIVI